MRIYLAGGFFREGKPNWRYGLVNGLESCNPPVIRHGPIEKWGLFEKAVFNCFDFVGPFRAEISYNPFRQAIKDCDIVFGWANDLLPPEEAKLSAEIAFASAKGKLVGIGSTHEADPTWNNIRFAHSMSSFFPSGYIAETPEQSLKQCLKSLLSFVSLEKQIELWKSPHSRSFFEYSLDRAGYVYLVKAETGHCKIGRTSNVPKRMNLFGVKLPFKWELIHTIPCQDMYAIESMLHRLFGNKRINGEWFNLTDAEERFVKSISECREDELLGDCDTSEVPEVEAALWDIALEN